MGGCIKIRGVVIAIRAGMELAALSPLGVLSLLFNMPL